MKKSIYGIAIALVAVPLTVFALTEGTVQKQVANQARTQSAGEEIRAKVQEMTAAREERKAEIKTQILGKAKESATRAIARTESRYEKIRERVLEMPNISEELKVQVSDLISADLVTLGSLKAEVELAESTEEVRAVILKLRTSLKASKTAVRAKVDALHATRLQKAVTALTDVNAKLDAKIVTLEESGKDVAGLKVVSDDAKSQITEATTRINAKEFTEAKESILAARKNLIELAQEIKAIN